MRKSIVRCLLLSISIMPLCHAQAEGGSRLAYGRGLTARQCVKDLLQTLIEASGADLKIAVVMKFSTVNLSVIKLPVTNRLLRSDKFGACMSGMRAQLTGGLARTWKYV
jgi:hypothetical protein